MEFLDGLVVEEMSVLFLVAAKCEFRLVDKSSFYGWLYGNAKSWKFERDFMVMYLMGGEI